jgi:restriction endonuclease S subunit
LAIVQDEIKKGNINQNIARVRITDNSINPYFAGLFFNSRYGQFQIERLITGNAQPYLNSEQIEALVVPVFSKNEQESFVRYFEKIQNEIKISKKLYRQAETLLLEELGLKDFEQEEKLFSIVNLSEVMGARRMDAEYFQGKYKKILSLIRANSGIKLDELVSIKNGIEVGAEEYQDNGRLFIRVSSMTKYGIVESDQKYLSDKLYESLKKDFEPKMGEILLTKDATPGIAHVLKEDIQGIVSGGTLRLKLKNANIESEYLSLCLNSIIGQMQAERDAGGSVIAHWKPEQIKDVLIPILPKEIQQKIADLVQKSHTAQKKAKELLEEAKRKVEEMIEKEG